MDSIRGGMILSHRSTRRVTSAYEKPALSFPKQPFEILDGSRGPFFGLATDFFRLILCRPELRFQVCSGRRDECCNFNGMDK